MKTKLFFLKFTKFTEKFCFCFRKHLIELKKGEIEKRQGFKYLLFLLNTHICSIRFAIIVIPRLATRQPTSLIPVRMSSTETFQLGGSHLQSQEASNTIESLSPSIWFRWFGLEMLSVKSLFDPYLWCYFFTSDRHCTLSVSRLICIFGSSFVSPILFLDLSSCLCGRNNGQLASSWSVGSRAFFGSRADLADLAVLCWKRCRMSKVLQHACWWENRRWWSSHLFDRVFKGII